MASMHWYLDGGGFVDDKEFVECAIVKVLDYSTSFRHSLIDGLWSQFLEMHELTEEYEEWAESKSEEEMQGIEKHLYSLVDNDKLFKSDYIPSDNNEVWDEVVVHNAMNSLGTHIEYLQTLGFATDR